MRNIFSISKRWTVAVGLIVVFLGFPNFLIADEPLQLTAPQSKAIEFKKDQQEPLFTFNASGGFRIANQGAKPLPNFQVFADGRIVTGGANPGTPNLNAQMTEAELTRFLNFVVNENQFFEIDPDALKQSMEAKRATVRIADAPTSTFKIQVNQGTKEVSIYALWFSVSNFPELDELNQLSKIEKRCKLIVSKIQLGDDADMVLKQINEAVEKLGLGIKPFVIDELENSARSANGRFQARFGRNLSPDQTTAPANPTFNAIYFQKDSKTAPEVKFYGLPKK